MDSVSLGMPATVSCRVTRVFPSHCFYLEVVSPPRHPLCPMTHLQIDT